MGESIQACEWAPETVLLGKSGRHIKGISKSSFSPREKKAKAIILQLPSILPASGEWGSPGVRGAERLLRKMTLQACTGMAGAQGAWVEHYEVCYREKKSEEQI